MKEAICGGLPPYRVIIDNNGILSLLYMLRRTPNFLYYRVWLFFDGNVGVKIVSLCGKYYQNISKTLENEMQMFVYIVMDVNRNMVLEGF